MADTDTSVVEILKKAVEGDIEKRVYEKIKDDIFKLKIFGVAGAALFALLITFHQAIFSFIVHQGGDGFRNEINKSIEEEKKQIDAAAMQFNIVRQNTLKELELFQTTLLTYRTTIIETRTELGAERDRMQQVLDSMTNAREATLQRVGAAQKSADDVRQQLDDRINDVRTLLDNQNAIIARLQTINPGTVQTKPIKIDPPSEKPKSTVYFQFAGFTREQAETISKALKDRGWSIPGEERTISAVNTNQLRHHPDDVQLANALLPDVNAALAPFRVVLTPQANPKVTRGIPEIWLYKP